MRSLMTAVLVVVMVLIGWGCTGASANTVTEGDRQVLAQTDQAAAIVHAKHQLAIAMLTLDVPKIAEAVEVLKEADQPLADVAANTKQLIKNYGPPKEAPPPYSKEASKAAREQSEKDHTVKIAIWGAVIAAVTWFLSSPIAKRIPYIGPFLAVLSPNATKQENLTKVLQVGLEEGRNELDAKVAKLVADGKITAEVAALLPNGDTLKGIIERELNRRGLLAFNTKVYEKNPLIPEAPATTPS